MANETSENGNTTKTKRQQTAERRDKAIAMRLAGHDYRRIASECGYNSPAGAYRIIQRHLAAHPVEPAAELIALETQRLDQMLRLIWPAVRLGELPAIDRALHIQERRAKLLGLDAPAKIDLTARIRQEAIAHGIDPDAAVRAAEEIVQGFR